MDTSATIAERVPEAASGELTRHRKPLKALTGIRFFAALYVVVFHTRLSQILLDHGSRIGRNFIANGFLAVPLFFLLSGFILAYTYAGQMLGPGKLRRFWEARFARIWPVYALSLALMAMAGEHTRPGAMWAAVLMVQAWNPFDMAMAGAGNMVCWTLSCEAFFYVCFPPAQRWLERRGARVALGAAVAMLALCVAFNTGYRSLGYPAEGVFRYLPFPLLHLPEFLAGVGLGNYFLAAQVRPNRLIGVGAWTYGWAGATLALLCRTQGRWTSLVGVAFAALLLGLAAEETRLSRALSSKAALLGGGMSYTLYLMQMPMKIWGTRLAERLGVGSVGVRLAMTMLLLLVFSWVVFEAVEEPARRSLRHVFAAIEARRSSLRTR